MLRALAPVTLRSGSSAFLRAVRRTANAQSLLGQQAVGAHTRPHATVCQAVQAPEVKREGKEGNAAYPFKELEQKWQAYWEANKTFRTPEKVDTSKPKYYVLDMFPYPSGAGLHVGHPEGYTATDIMARYKRMLGHNVLHPMGWDAFGLPAEQYAIDTGTHPAITTKRNVNRFREQLKSLGFSYDWDREVATCDEDYYRWTQWIFLRLYEKGLAYQAEVPVNWCPALGTVLANEEVIEGLSERGGHPVIRKPMRQWMLKITAYADRLLEDLDDLDWSDNIKEMQRNWIGRSEGAQMRFDVVSAAGEATGDSVEVFTTRPDTLFGATFVVLAPEHPLARKVAAPAAAAAVAAYIDAASKKSDLERTDLAKEKSGVATGGFVRNPATGEPIPVWVADYVLGGYGSGAIMAVPAHDKRDLEFARAFGIAVRPVVSGGEAGGEAAYAGEGLLMNSANAATGLSIDGLSTKDAAAKVISWLKEKGIGESRVNYKLRDWLFARQRYWGEPFPVVFREDGTVVPLRDDQLPVKLPETDQFRPSGSGEGPLANLLDWVNTVDPVTGAPAKRETNTMPQWAGSCWYYLRFIDPKNAGRAVDPELEKYWMPVDLYVGGAEHAVLHLLYARFWHKVLYDIGVVSTKEPFGRLVSQGMILGETEYTVGRRAADGAMVAAEAAAEGVELVKLGEAEVVKKGEGFVMKADPKVRVSARSFKMSKSRGNVVNPDDVVDSYGADSLRLYEMFMGPLRETKVWNTRSVDGVYRFLGRVWRLFAANAGCLDAKPTAEQLTMLHSTIKRVTEDTEGMRFNTAISAMMEFTNAATKWEATGREVLAPFALLLAPYAPHIAEELWAALGHTQTLAYEPWPVLEEKYLVKSTVSIAVQVNGKVRATVEVAVDATQEVVAAAAFGQAAVTKYMEGKQIKKQIFVPGRIFNVVVA